MSQNSTIAHFGLGSATVIDSVIVTWTGGTQQLLTGQPVNTLLTVVEPKKSRSGKLFLCGFIVGVLGVGLAVYWKRKSDPA